MALLSSVTDAGTNLNALALEAAGTPTNITRIELGTGHVTTIEAVSAQTGIVTPFTPRRESIDPPVFAAGPTGQTVYFDGTRGLSFVYSELAIFAGTTCIYYECDDAGAAIGGKASDSDFNKLITFTYSNGDASLVTREFVHFPLGTKKNFGMVKFAEDSEVGTDPDNDELVLTQSQIRALVAAVQAGLTPSQVQALIATYIASNLEFADKTEAEAGTAADKVMSPLRSREGMLAYKLPAAPTAYDDLTKIGAAIRDWANQDGWTVTPLAEFLARTTRVPGRMFCIPE